MPCALCTRYRTEGRSRCPGCSSDGYYTQPCKTHHCCKERGVGHCGNCGEFPCARLEKIGDFRDLNTNHAKERNCGAVAQVGFERWLQEYAERADLLTLALERYNNGRMKRYLCELFIQWDMKALRDLMARAAHLDGDPKERGRRFRELAEVMRAAMGGERGEA